MGDEEKVGIFISLLLVLSFKETVLTQHRLRMLDEIQMSNMAERIREVAMSELSPQRVCVLPERFEARYVKLHRPLVGVRRWNNSRS